MSNANAALVLDKFLDLRTDDFDDLSRAFPWRDQRYDQIGGGIFRGGLVIAKLGGFYPFEISGSHPLRAHGYDPSDAYSFGVIGEPNMGAVWRGRTFRPGTIIFYRPGEEMDLRTTCNYATSGLIVRTETLRHLVSLFSDKGLDELLHPPHFLFAPRDCDAFHGVLREAFDRLKCTRTPELTASTLRDFLAQWLTSVIRGRTNTPREVLPSRGAIRRALLARMAEDYMLAHLDCPLVIPEICRHLGVSDRTLINAFREQLGLPPKAYYSALKLNKLRRTLKEAGPGERAICALARPWGMNHSGSLAADYRDLFGELPTQTLLRLNSPPT